MRCPYCSSPAVEHQEECPRCGFSLPKLEGWFGAIPRLSPGISDNAALFRPAEHRRVERQIARFRRIFPQISMHLVTINLNPGDNLSLYTFWIFNRSGICNDMAPGAGNRNILMIIDAYNQRTCLTAGYGLEPFIGERHLAAIGAAAAADLREGRYAAGAIAAIGCLSETLVEIHDKLEETYGIVVDNSEAPLAEAVPANELYY